MVILINKYNVSSNIYIKELKLIDWDYVLKLRNKTRKFYNNSDIVTKDEHYNYMSNTSAIFWIVYYNNERVGFLKLNNSDLAIALDEKIRGKRFAKQILKMGIDKTNIKLTAMIKKDNIPSLKLYRSLGYL